MRTRIAVRLALGILFGVVLVLLPGVFSTTSPLTAPTSPTGYTTQSHGLGGFTPTTALAGPSSAVSGVSFFAIVAFILLPSVVFSLIVRRWVERRARDYSGESPI